MNKRTSKKNIAMYKKRNNYSSITKEAILFDILMFIFIFAGILLIKRSISIVQSNNITYKENSNLDYNVKLKKNEFYETDSLGKGMVYIASLIDKINITFNYKFNIDKKSNIDFDYDIIGKLVISDNNDRNNTFFEKEQVLLKKTKEKINNEEEYTINKSISIDYDYYNDLANKFRIKYGIDASCNLIVYLNVHKQNKNNNFELNNNSLMSLTIPLSKKAINITLDYKEIDKTSKLVRSKEVKINNYTYFITGITSLIVGIYFIYRYVKLILKFNVKKSKFDKYISKLLNEYDRLIVETSTPPNLRKKDIIKIKRFQELLDVRDNLKLPIKHYVAIKHIENIFYINNDNELYLLILNSRDFE